MSKFMKVVIFSFFSGKNLKNLDFFKHINHIISHCKSNWGKGIMEGGGFKPTYNVCVTIENERI